MKDKKYTYIRRDPDTGEDVEIGALEIMAKGEREANILVYGDIGDPFAEDSVTAAKFVRDLQNVKAEQINVRINSFGGVVSDATAIYNALRRHPANVDTFVDGVALSAASLIAMAGRTMTMAGNAALMIHGPHAMARGNAQQMRKAADTLDIFAQMMAPSYAAKTGKPTADMLALLTDGVDHWFTAAEAKAAGFADAITEAVPVTAQFDLQRFGAVPAAAAAFTRSNTMPDITPAAQPTAAQPQLPLTPAAPAAPAPVAPQPAAPVAAAPVLAVVNPRTKEQIAEIKAAFQPFMQREGVAAAYTTVLEDPAMSVEAARQQLLTTLGANSSPATPQAHSISLGADERDKFRAACVLAVMARTGQASAEERKTIGQNPYRGLTLLELCKASLDRINVSHRGMDPMSIAASAITQSTSDFPVLLEEVINKTLRGAYATQPDTWRRFCASGSVSDFKVNRRYRLGSFANLTAVNENGEFKNMAIPDGEKSTIQADTKGNIINLTRKMIINDDLGAFVGLAAGLGRAAKRTVEADVYALIAQNSGAGPTMSDTGILFNSTAITTPGGHANRAAYAAPTVALLDAARVAMKKQKDPSQNDFLDLSPAIAVVPSGLAAAFKILNGSVYDPGTESGKPSTKPNAVAGIVQDIVDSPRITWNAWYLFADPSIAPVIEVAFLNGNQEPFTEQMPGFRVDGVEWKVRLDYGVAEVDYRGGYASVGS